MRATELAQAVQKTLDEAGLDRDRYSVREQLDALFAGVSDESLRDSTLAARPSRLLAEGMPPGVMRRGPLEPAPDVAGPLLTIDISEPLIVSLDHLSKHLGWPLTDVARLALSRGVTELLAIDPRHSVRVVGVDGETRLECDHSFKGGPNCVHCHKAFAELQREALAEAEQLRREPMVDPVRAEQLRRREAERLVEVVSIVIGPSLRQRVAAVVQTNRLGTRLDLVVQTMFILGLLDAEGMDPHAYIGEPKQHVSHDGVFLRFALPHDGDAVRLEVLRSVFAWLHAWLGDGDPLQPAAAAALAALPR
jgi:hypothetical protein